MVNTHLKRLGSACSQYNHNLTCTRFYNRNYWQSRGDGILLYLEQLAILNKRVISPEKEKNRLKLKKKSKEKKTTKPFFLSADLKVKGALSVPRYAPRHQTNCGRPNSFQNAVVMMLIRLLRLRHPRSSEYAHWSSSLDVPGRSVGNRSFVGRWLISNTPLLDQTKQIKLH